MRTRTTLAAAAALLAACTPRSAPPVTAGTRIFDGQAQALAPSPDGSRLAWLTGCGPGEGPGRPSGCTLLVAPVGGGAPVRVAEGIAPAAGSFAWMTDGALLALARRDPATGAGDLFRWSPVAEARLLAPRVTSFATGAGGRLVMASGGEVLVVAPGADPTRLTGGTGAFEVAVAPAPGRAVAARARGAGGSPVLLLWRNGAGEGVAVARDVGSFAFSSDGAWLAAVAGVAPGTEGSLLALRVEPGPGGGAEPVRVARGVGPFRWAEGGARLAWLEGFDPRAHAGRLASGVPGEGAVALGDRVTSFEIAPGGLQVAFVRHVTQGGYAANLDLSPTAAAEPGTLAQDPAGFTFSPDGRWLWYRAGCAPSGDACTLFRAPAAGLGPSQAPTRIADGVVAFSLAPGSSDRALLAFGRRDGAGVDLSAWTGARLVPLDTRVSPSSAVWLGPDGRRAAWVGGSAERPAILVADVP